ELDRFDVEGIPAFAERVLPRASDLLGAGLAESEAAAAPAVLPGRDCLRRKTICSNRRNHARVQLLNVRRRLRKSSGVPNGIRTRVLALKGPRPGPLDDGDVRERAEESTRTLAVFSVISVSSVLFGRRGQVYRNSRR